MMRLDLPKYKMEHAVNLCAKGITGNHLLHGKLINGKDALIKCEENYESLSRGGSLFQINPLSIYAEGNLAIVDNLTGSELIKVYNQYFVPEGKPARIIYDELLNSAKEKCPFCGGIGTPRTLDHFLPKSKFPQYSILTSNLVPSCFDCNIGDKGSDHALDAASQTIQPYLDLDIFFIEQWIFADYFPGNDLSPGYFKYYVRPPVGWDAINVNRCTKHFDDFKIGRRYATKAAENLGVVLNQIQLLSKRGLSMEVIKSDLLVPGITKSPFVNHWHGIMCQSLNNSF